MLSGYEDILETLAKFHRREIPFIEYREWLFGAITAVGYDLEPEWAWETIAREWLQLVEEIVPEQDRYKYGCSVGHFLEDAIVNEPIPVRLPMVMDYKIMLRVIFAFRQKRMDFHEYVGRLRGSVSTLCEELSPSLPWEKIEDNWLETLEYCVPQSEWYEYGCSFGRFIEDAIVNEPRPLVPFDDIRKVRELWPNE